MSSANISFFFFFFFWQVAEFNNNKHHALGVNKDISHDIAHNVFHNQSYKILERKAALKACRVIYFSLFYGHFNKLSLIDRTLSFAWVHLGCSHLHGNRDTLLPLMAAKHFCSCSEHCFIGFFCMNHSNKTVPVLSSVIC